MNFNELIKDFIVPLLVFDEKFIEISEENGNLKLFRNERNDILITIGVNHVQGRELVLFLNKSGQEYDIDDLITLTKIHVPTYMINDLILFESIKKVRMILEFKNNSLLKGSKKMYKELKKIRDSRIDKYNKEKEIERIVKEADFFWQNQKYQNYIDTVEDHLESLPVSFGKRLIMAKKRLDNLK